MAKKGTRQQATQVKKREYTEAQLHQNHRELCSMDSPECPKTFTPGSFERHVLYLMSAKEKVGEGK